MERDRRYNRQGYYTHDQDRQTNHLKRVDEDVYRGAYRFDNESDHHNETTYDGFDLNDSMAHHNNDQDYRNERNQGGDYVYRRSRDRQDNDIRATGRYRDDYYRNERERYGNRNDQYSGRSGNSTSNFNNDYAPDPYRNQNREQNYGNMAGSLSFGYDGDYNSDPDYKRRYDPLSGEIRQRRPDNRTRHPQRYGPPDEYGINPDYDRY